MCKWKGRQFAGGAGEKAVEGFRASGAQLLVSSGDCFCFLSETGSQVCVLRMSVVSNPVENLNPPTGKGCIVLLVLLKMYTPPAPPLGLWWCVSVPAFSNFRGGSHGYSPRKLLTEFISLILPAATWGSLPTAKVEWLGHDGAKFWS